MTSTMYAQRTLRKFDPIMMAFCLFAIFPLLCESFSVHDFPSILSRRGQTSVLLRASRDPSCSVPGENPFHPPTYLEQNLESFRNENAWTSRPSFNKEDNLAQWAPTAEHSEAQLSETLDESTQQNTGSDRDILVARGLLIGAAALYGTNFALVKVMGEQLPVGLSTTLRFGIASLSTMPWLLRPTETPAEADTARGAAIAGFEVGLWNSIGYIAQAVGLGITPAGESAFLCSLAVVVVPFLDLISGRKLKGREWIGAGLAMAGVAMLELGGGDAFAGALSYGKIVSMIQPLAFGMGFARMERAMHKYPNQANRSTASQLLAAAMGAAIYCTATEGFGRGEASWDLAQLKVWLSEPMILAFIAWTGVVSTALSIYMETVALKTLSAAETTLFLSTEPLWGAAFAAVVIGEHFGIDAYVGGLMILFGCVYSNLGMTGLKGILSRETTPMTSNQSTPPPLGIGSIILAAGLSEAWNNISVGARVTVLQIQDLVEGLWS